MAPQPAQHCPASSAACRSPLLHAASARTACTGRPLLQAVIEDFREKELGGRVLTCMTGSAPTAPEVVDFLRDALVVPIYEGYGSTECGELPHTTPAIPW